MKVLNLNFLLFIIGMIGVITVTQFNGWAVFWAVVASMHFKVTYHNKYE